MIKERKDIDPKYKWDLTAIYPTEADFEADRAHAEERIRAFAVHESTMNTSAEALYAALTEKQAISDLMGKLWQYASLSSAVDIADTVAQARQTRMRNLYVLRGEIFWFFTPRMMALDEETVEKWYRECPKLEAFRRKIGSYLRFRPHALNDDGEKLLAEMEDALGSHTDIYSILTDAEMRFGKIRGEDGKLTELSDTNYMLYIKSRDRRVRRAAFHRLYAGYAQFAGTIAALYEARVKEETTDARIRRYPDSITASTDRDEVTPAIYGNLIDTVHRGLPVLHEYYRMKRDLLGLEKMHLYDVYTPLVGASECTYTYEEAIDQVLKTVKVFGEEYVSVLRAGLCERGWADVYPSRGKRGGAFSSSSPNTEPYILMNFNGRFQDISTLAHEAGHSMHSYFTAKNNPSQDAHYTIFVAEVASTVNELLLSHRRIAESESREEKLALLNELMETYRATLYRQTMFAEFEREMHAKCEAGVPLTKDEISSYYLSLNRLYFGDGVVCDKDIAYEWTRIPHFYRCFYVYKYATCISAASAIVKRIETEGDAYVGKYLKFLSAGDSLSPLESLRLAEIDMECPEVVESAVRDFEAAIEQFKALWNEK